jgi:iron complex transport system substrate-binding protein
LESPKICRPGAAARLGLLAGLLLSAACDGAAPRGGDAGALVVVDEVGREVHLHAPAQRVLSLVPARTEVLLAMGAGDRLIARTQYDPDPRLAHLPSIGNALNPSVEWVAAQRPDLVVAWADTEARAVVARIADLGIPVYGSRVETLADNDRSIAALGRLLAMERQADSLRTAISAELDSVRAAVAGRPRPRVLYAVSAEPVVAAGPGTFVDELLEIAGAANVAADLAPGWPQLSLEEIVRRDPDHIVVSVGGGDAAVAARLARLPGWRDLAAVRGGRLHIVDAHEMNRPGANVGAAARRLAALFYGVDDARP